MEEKDVLKDKLKKTSTDSEVDKSIRSKKEKKPKKDYDLNDQIDSIRSLSNKESVLKLCRLMFRTENVESRIDILDLLLVSSFVW